MPFDRELVAFAGWHARTAAVANMLDDLCEDRIPK
jgi:hypothetical protein